MKAFQIMLAATAALTLSCMQPVYAQTKTTESPSPSFLADDNKMVMFNEESKKYHALSCAHAKKCTHCVRIRRSEAKSKGGVACKTCKGGD